MPTRVENTRSPSPLPRPYLKSRMEPEAPKPWWSWAPNFPKPAIIAMALAANLVIAGTWLYGIFVRGGADLYNPNPVWDVLVNANLAANLTVIMVAIQLNYEVLPMILTSKRNHWEKEQAVAKVRQEAKAAREQAIAETRAETQAETQAAERAAARAWFEAWQRDPNTAPPPPWARNGSNPGSDSGYTL